MATCCYYLKLFFRGTYQSSSAEKLKHPSQEPHACAFLCFYILFSIFLKSLPVNNDQKGHDNVQLASVLVLLENRNTSVHFFAQIALL